MGKAVGARSLKLLGGHVRLSLNAHFLGYMRAFSKRDDNGGTAGLHA